MKTIRTASATLALVGLLGVIGSGAAVADESKAANANCRQETKRVAVWPRTPPKAPQMARFEEHLVTICDNKVVSSKRVPHEKQLHAKDSGD